MPYAPLGFAACTFQPLSRSHSETRQLYSLSPQPRSASSARALALAEPGLGAGTAGGLGAGTAGGGLTLAGGALTRARRVRGVGASWAVVRRPVPTATISAFGLAT